MSFVVTFLVPIEKWLLTYTVSAPIVRTNYGLCLAEQMARVVRNGKSTFGGFAFSYCRSLDVK